MGHVACMGDKCVHCLAGTSEGKRLLGKPMCRWADNIEIDLVDMWQWQGGGGFLGWIHLPCGEVAVNTDFSISVVYTGEQLALCSSRIAT